MSFFIAIFKFFLQRRYHIDVRGFEVFDTDAPVVVLPNHPALVDPMIMLSVVAQKKLLSPIMTETYYHTFGMEPLFRALWTVSVWDISRGGTIEDMNSAFSGMIDAVSAWKNILLYPSGHVYVQPFEHIVWKKMAYELISRLPEGTKIIVARTTGLWWSLWSKAYTGTSPELTKVFLKSLWYMIANGIFFLPKREVQIEYIDMTDDLLKWQKDGLNIFNKKLQDLYNKRGDEVCHFIPHYSYWNDIYGKIEPKNIIWSVAELAQNHSDEEVDKDIASSILHIVAEIKKIDVSILSLDTNLILDISSDSLDMAEMKAKIQSEYPSASNPAIASLKTIRDLGLMATGELSGGPEFPPVSFESAESKKFSYAYKEWDTILSVSKKVFLTDPKKIWIYDTILWEMDRDTFLLRSYVISHTIQKYQNPYIGIMLPALSATSLLIYGTYLSGKTPVMLNWTVWEKSFEHCMNFSKLDVILTSRKFYEKISSEWLRNYEWKMIFLEDIIASVSLYTKLHAVIRKHFFLSKKQSDTAVILFTSGSESLPKAVPLTQKNILTNIEWAIRLVPFHKGETFLGILPPFHSFGFTINTIFPLIAPMQVAYTPDPTDARTISHMLTHTHASILSATPTFLKMILVNGKNTSFSSLKYAFVGAEKCNDEIFNLFTGLCSQASLLEWYGITECSPIVTTNSFGAMKRNSVWRFLPTLSSMIRSLDDKNVLWVGEQGMIYVSGPSIFDGYLDNSIESPFQKYNWKNWYKTGDLGYLDADGYLFITGRLKRFIKIAWEMISLPQIESVLLEKYGNPDAISLAIEALENENWAVITIFTTQDISLEEANEYIHKHWISNLVKITNMHKVQFIPLLGSGKIDYKLLKSLI